MPWKQNFWMTTNWTFYLKVNLSCFKLHWSHSISFYNLSKVGEIFWGWIQKFKKKKNACHVFTYSIKWASEIRIMFHVAVMPGRLRNEKKKKRDARAKLLFFLLLFSHSHCHRCCPCFSSLFLWSRNFATMVMWCHTSPLCFKIFLNLRLLNSKVGIYASISCSACEIFIFSVWYMCFCSTVTVLLC